MKEKKNLTVSSKIHNMNLQQTEKIQQMSPFNFIFKVLKDFIDRTVVALL